MQNIIEQLNQYYNYEEFEKFINANGILSTAAGVIIAYAAWDLIKSLVGDIVLPGFYFLCIHPFIQKDIVSLIFAPIEKIDIPNFTKNLVSFIAVLIITFVTINYISKAWIHTERAKAGTTQFTEKPAQVHEQPTIEQTRPRPQPATQYESSYAAGIIPTNLSR